MIGVTRLRARGAAVFAAALLVAATLTAIAQVAANAWRQAEPGYEFRFARDHASHPDYRVEWWYYTGNLDARDGRRFGYQLTFFRIGVDPNPANPSRWAVRDLFMAHLAVTDVGGKRYRYAERLNRAGVGWAGADAGRYRVWNEDWEARFGGEGGGTHLLRAIDANCGVELELGASARPVIHGANGISRKGAQAGNASHYYSYTRMPTRGAVWIEGERVEVEGASWMDHEFGTSFLEREQRGWDWFSIQLDDHTDLMVFQLRRADGSRDENSSGTIVFANGDTAPIAAADLDLAPEPGATWTSRASRATYPTAWRVQVPGRGLDLRVRAAFEDQELRTDGSAGVTYWEGAVDVEGTRDGRAVGGRGYLEMTGYAAGASMGTLLE